MLWCQDDFLTPGERSGLALSPGARRYNHRERPMQCSIARRAVFALQVPRSAKSELQWELDRAARWARSGPALWRFAAARLRLLPLQAAAAGAVASLVARLRAEALGASRHRRASSTFGAHKSLRTMLEIASVLPGKWAATRQRNGQLT